MPKYTLKCLDAKYIEEEELLVLNCYVSDINQKRILCFYRSDFCFRQPGLQPPHNEMHRTADMWRGKPFVMDLQENEGLEKIKPEDQERYARMFGNQMGDHMMEVAKGLEDESKKVQRRLGDVMEKNEKNRSVENRSIESVLEEEMAIRQKLNSLSFK